MTAWFKSENERQSPDTTNGRQLCRECRLIKKFARSRESWKGQIGSGFMITKLVTEIYAANIEREDKALYDTMKAMRDRLENDPVVKHPVTPDSTITNGDDDPKAKFLKDKLSDAISWLDVLFKDDCAAEEAMKAWDKVFSTTYFTDTLEAEEDEKQEEQSAKSAAATNSGLEIALLLTRDFPFDKAVIALADAPPPLTYPHVEDNGALCLLPDSATFSPHHPVEVTISLLRDAAGLVEDCLSKRNQEDFRREFHSYWNRFLSDEKTKIVSLLDPQPPSRVVQVWKGNGIYVFGDDAVTLKFWLQNSFGKKNYNLEPAVFLWLSQTLVPLEYPKTNFDLAMLAQRQTEKGVAILRLLISKVPN